MPATQVPANPTAPELLATDCNESTMASTHIPTSGGPEKFSARKRATRTPPRSSPTATASSASATATESSSPGHCGAKSTTGTEAPCAPGLPSRERAIQPASRGGEATTPSALPHPPATVNARAPRSASSHSSVRFCCLAIRSGPSKVSFKVTHGDAQRGGSTVRACGAALNAIAQIKKCFNLCW